MASRRGREDDSEEARLVVPDQVASNLVSISRSLAAIALRLSRSSLKTDKERIHYLEGLGLDRNDIAGILGTTPGTVSVRLSEKRSSRTRSRSRRGKN